MCLFLEKVESQKNSVNRHRNRQKKILSKPQTMIDVEWWVEQKKAIRKRNKKCTGTNAREVAELERRQWIGFWFRYEPLRITKNPAVGARNTLEVGSSHRIVSSPAITTTEMSFFPQPISSASQPPVESKSINLSFQQINFSRTTEIYLKESGKYLTIKKLLNFFLQLNM